jgi:V/A-type H+-transporting ATPase subunit B
MALTAAEYLAYEKDMHVLVILTDMTNYAEALREVSAAKKEVPGRRGYPGFSTRTLRRCMSARPAGSASLAPITMIPSSWTMPEDDKTHPITPPTSPAISPQGKIHLQQRAAPPKGIVPPVDVLPSCPV